jgi:protein Tex
LDEGNTLPFIARYRKEATGSLDEIQIRAIESALKEFKELVARKKTILGTIEEQGKLTDELRKKIEGCWDKAELEDIYLPYKPKKRTRAQVAREAGLEPLALMMLGMRPFSGTVQETASKFLNPDKGIETVEDALAGARDIAAEFVTNSVSIRGAVREFARRTARLKSAKKRGADDETVRPFLDYVGKEESLCRIPPHRFLAVMRGEDKSALSAKVVVDEERCRDLMTRPLERRIPGPFRSQFAQAVEDGFKRLLWPAITRELLADVKTRSDEGSVNVFEGNLRSVLMAPPAGQQVVLGVDPGFRTGCKAALVSGTGEVLATATIYPNPPQNNAGDARRKLEQMVAKHTVGFVAVGDGTAHRETLRFLESVSWPGKVQVVPVSEAGASVYSASVLAGKELPGMDVSMRGAVSIARRFQDPLAELVKIDPKSIGVGQYQHDVDQKMLVGGLEGVVEECVNRVGVELNLASPALLSHVAGIGPKLAGAIVDFRASNGRFAGRTQLKKVPGMGPARFTQCAGFLRIRDAREMLDRTAVHPESYGVVKRVAKQVGVKMAELMEDADVRTRFGNVARDQAELGRETLADVLSELEKPGRDPRGEFKTFSFMEGVENIEDLAPGMTLPGKVTNITDFGAFVDIGVHRDGLVHISRLADRRVNSPFDVCKPGQQVQVKVLEVDTRRNRISLTMRPSDM